MQKRQPFSLWGMAKSPYGLMVGKPPASDTQKHSMDAVNPLHSMRITQRHVLDVLQLNLAAIIIAFLEMLIRCREYRFNF